MQSKVEQQQVDAQIRRDNRIAKVHRWERLKVPNYRSQSRERNVKMRKREVLQVTGHTASKEKEKMGGVMRNSLEHKKRIQVMAE